jgi:hypothetical protein
MKIRRIAGANGRTNGQTAGRGTTCLIFENVCVLAALGLIAKYFTSVSVFAVGRVCYMARCALVDNLQLSVTQTYVRERAISALCACKLWPLATGRPHQNQADLLIEMSPCFSFVALNSIKTLNRNIYSSDCDWV